MVGNIPPNMAYRPHDPGPTYASATKEKMTDSLKLYAEFVTRKKKHDFLQDENRALKVRKEILSKDINCDSLNEDQKKCP